MVARRVAAAVLALALCAAAAPSASAQSGRKPLDVKVFARVPSPGQPEPIAIGPDGNIYVGTNQLGKGDAADQPSRIFVFADDGRLIRSIVLRGQKLDEDHGIQGLAFDGDGLLYALDRAHDPRVVVIEPDTGRQSDYARFRDVPPCSPARTADCSATVNDAEAIPDYATFGPDGSLYVTDLEQALIWRVPPGGGRAEVWLTDASFENIFGPNGLAFLGDGRTMMLALSAQSPAAGNPTVGRLITFPVRPDGRPGELRSFWESRPADGPDGFAVGRSGTIYLALAAANQLAVISARGEETARVPATPIENRALEVPFDGPGSVAFLGNRLLVTNHSFLAGNSRSWAVLDVFAGEPGLALQQPRLAPAPLPARGARCVRAVARLGGRRLGGLRVGARRTELARRAASAPTRRGLSLRWCVTSGGRVAAALSRTGRARLIATTAPRHRARSIRVGARLPALRARFPRARRVAAGLYADLSTGLAFGVRAGRVRWLAVGERSLLVRPRVLRIYARRAGLG